MDEKGWREAFWLQEPHQGGQGEQVHQERSNHKRIGS